MFGTVWKWLNLLFQNPTSEGRLESSKLKTVGDMDSKRRNINEWMFSRVDMFGLWLKYHSVSMAVFIIPAFSEPYLGHMVLKYVWNGSNYARCRVHILWIFWDIIIVENNGNLLIPTICNALNVLSAFSLISMAFSMYGTLK